MNFSNGSSINSTSRQHHSSGSGNGGGNNIGGTCDQGTQTPKNISRETSRSKFKFHLNNVTAPALNLNLR